MTLNGVMAVILRYFTEFGKPALQKTIMAEFVQESIVFLVRVQCRRKDLKFTFAISSPDEFLVRNPPESYRIRRNYATVRAITPFKVIQGHRVWYQSKAHNYATSYQ